MGVVPISKSFGSVLDKIGVYAFFVVIAVFGVWVIGTFFKNMSTLKGGEVH
jgi:hypothetical protein